MRLGEAFLMAVPPTHQGPPAVLAGVPVGRTVVLAGSREGAATHGHTRRLCQLGLRPGAHVSVIRRTVGGGRLLGLGEARVAVDRATARALAVTGVETETTPGAGS